MPRSTGFAGRSDRTPCRSSRSTRLLVIGPAAWCSDGLVPVGVRSSDTLPSLPCVGGLAAFPLCSASEAGFLRWALAVGRGFVRAFRLHAASVAFVLSNPNRRGPARPCAAVAPAVSSSLRRAVPPTRSFSCVGTAVLASASAGLSGGLTGRCSGPGCYPVRRDVPQS